MMILDAGHYGLEHVFMDYMEEFLNGHFRGLIQVEKMPVEFPAAVI